MSENGVQNLKARYLFPILGPPIPDGVVSVAGDRIVAVGRHRLPGPVEDLGSVGLLPGLINAHTHLDFSLLDQPIGQPGIPFVQWLRLVVKQFREGGSEDKYTYTAASVPSPFGKDSAFPASRPNASERAIQSGLAELIRSGTTAAADMAQPGFPSHLWTQSGMNAVVFLELRGPTRSRVSQALAEAHRHWEAWQADQCKNIYSTSPSGPSEEPFPAHGQPAAHPSSTGVCCREEKSFLLPSRKPQWPPSWQLGLGPHAPYSVHPELLEGAVLLARQYRLPMAMHLAESAEEWELLQTGRGPLRTFLEELGRWEPGLVQPPCRPLDYLRRLAQADRVLVIHGNYLEEPEWEFLSLHRDRMAVVFCPRSHAYFNHPPYPLVEMRSRGVQLILGTDSRASAPEANMLAELRTVAVRFPQLAPEHILSLATFEAAKALGWQQTVGALTPGRRADLTAVALPDRPGAKDPYELLLDSSLPVLATWIAGRKVFSALAERPEK